MDEKQTLDYRLIPLDTIELPVPGLRTLADPSTREELRESIRRRGVLVPIIVRELPEGYLLIAGRRRVLAAREAGLVTIPSSIVQPDSKWERWASLTENRMREPLNAYDEAHYLARIISEGKMNQKELAEVLDVGPNWVSQRIGILEWPTNVRNAVAEGKLGFAVARELAGIPSAAYRRLCVEQALRSGCTVRQAAEWRKASPAEPSAIPQVSASEPEASPGGLILGTPEVCGNCGASCVGVPGLLIHLCEKCLKALGTGLSFDSTPEVQSPPDV